ncbi:hypothetical protein PUNSTDRAFT_130092 [Punctularia strigosozonata HHB-11173 SS5]|uniref:uncharacterized protein n=1 Tax=Punctularia strigosozonata (strain HHB-11173) TaxID=741275 RepID=UPI0004416810|nr:uncharacterized protein PUNSTDRAFT_130092 [Punctularia strigosozonata HHB-11173 SS5]EIN14463.1 hypothetical protein PUNSTDRAFT_130092 [Punctularia strigosozonata HHB-11173 SS5]
MSVKHDPDAAPQTGELEYSFDHAASDVRGVFGGLEDGYAHPFMRSIVRPSLRFLQESFARHPLLTVWASVFAVLAALPIFSFIAFTLVVLTLTLLSAVFVALVTTVVAVLLSGFLLVFTLGFFFIVSAWLTGTFISLYLAYRLGAIARGRYTSVKPTGSPALRAHAALKLALLDWVEEIRFLLHLQTSVRKENSEPFSGRTGFPTDLQKEDAGTEAQIVDGFSVPPPTRGSDGSEASEPSTVEKPSTS